MSDVDEKVMNERQVRMTGEVRELDWFLKERRSLDFILKAVTITFFIEHLLGARYYAKYFVCVSHLVITTSL